MLCAIPGVSVKVDGCVDTPPGSPERMIVTTPVKPLAAVAFTLSCWPGPPGTSVIAVGAADKEKSAAGVGKGAGAGVDLPPQDIKPTQRSNPKPASAIFRTEPPIANLQNQQTPTPRYVVHLQDQIELTPIAPQICHADVTCFLPEGSGRTSFDPDPNAFHYLCLANIFEPKQRIGSILALMACRHSRIGATLF